MLCLWAKRVTVRTSLLPAKGVTLYIFIRPPFMADEMVFGLSSQPYIYKAERSLILLIL